jgi:glycosyltransferase involved in cell wall biosynthesis
VSKREDILVSVVIPTYSRNDMLERAINCIQKQTHQNLDIIVVDDNPPESEFRLSTQKIMQKYATDERIRYIQNPQNLGGAGARNVGIEASKGEYIAFLDDDDEYYPEKIEKQLQVFLDSKSDKLALVYCDVEHVGVNNHVDCVIRKRYRGNCLYEAIEDDCIASTSMWLVKKSILESVGNFSIVPCKQDSTVILKLLDKGYEVDFVPEVLCSYRNVASGVRISLGPRKVEGELMFYNACCKMYDRMTPKQIRYIEFSFAKRLYVLYSRRNQKWKEKRIAERNKMFRLRPIAAAAFLLRRKIHVWKHKMK